MTCFDLKLLWPIISDFQDFGGESVYAHRQIGVLATDGVLSVAPVRYVRPSLRRRSQGQNVSLQRTSAGDGLRAAYLSGESSRYRNLFAGRAVQMVSHGPSRRRLAQQSGERKSAARLADLRGLHPGPDRRGTIALRQGRLGHRLGGDRLRTRCLHDRSLPVDVSLGQVSPDQGGRKSEEHTSELQSRLHLVCRLLLEKKKKDHSGASPDNAATVRHAQR